MDTLLFYFLKSSYSKAFRGVAECYAFSRFHDNVGLRDLPAIRTSKAPMQIFQSLLCLVLLFGLLLCFPLGVLSLPILALNERLDFREQNAGKSLYLVIGNPHAAVISTKNVKTSLGVTPAEHDAACYANTYSRFFTENQQKSESKRM